MVDTRIKVWCVLAVVALATGGVAYARLPPGSPQNPPRPTPLQAPYLSPQHQRDLSV